MKATNAWCGMGERAGCTEHTGDAGHAERAPHREPASVVAASAIGAPPFEVLAVAASLTGAP